MSLIDVRYIMLTLSRTPEASIEDPQGAENHRLRTAGLVQNVIKT